MVRAVFHPADGGDAVDIDVPEGWTLMEGARQEAVALDTVHAALDADAYKILCKPVLRGQAEMVLL